MTRRSKSSVERRMAANKKAHRFGKVIDQIAIGDPGPLIRYSRIAGLLGAEAKASLDLDRSKAAHCPEHGELKDPVMVLVQSRVVFGCPWCSGPTTLARWEKEGAS